MSGSDQIIAGGAVIDTRASVKQFNATIGPTRGDGAMVLAPDVNSGSYFNDQDRSSRRAEWFATVSLTPMGPDHLVKTGGGLTLRDVRRLQHESPGPDRAIGQHTEPADCVRRQRSPRSKQDGRPRVRAGYLDRGSTSHPCVRRAL